MDLDLYDKMADSLIGQIVPLRGWPEELNKMGILLDFLYQFDQFSPQYRIGGKIIKTSPTLIKITDAKREEK